MTYRRHNSLRSRPTLIKLSGAGEFPGNYLIEAGATIAQASHKDLIGSVMFILKRQDVEISTVQHPTTGQQIPILNYQGQTFRLIKKFGAAQADEARAEWRDLTDNRGKACVLLEEPDRYSIWGKIKVEQIGQDGGASGLAATPALTAACLLLMQAVYFDIEDLLGNRQASAFQKDIAQVLQKWKFPQGDSPKAVKILLDMDPLEAKMPSWQEHHITTLLQELFKLGKKYFGNDSFAAGVLEVLDDLQQSDRQQFLDWMNQYPLGKDWGTG